MHRNRRSVAERDPLVPATGRNYGFLSTLYFNTKKMKYVNANDMCAYYGLVAYCLSSWFTLYYNCQNLQGILYLRVGDPPIGRGDEVCGSVSGAS